MKLEDIREALENRRSAGLRRAMEFARKNRDTATPQLLAIVQNTIENADAVPEDYMAHLTAMFLLAEFREPQICPLMVRLARLPIETLDYLLGDVITEELKNVLASVCDADSLKSIIEDNVVDEWVRNAALYAIAVQVAQGDLDQKEALIYFKTLFEGKIPRTAEYEVVWSGLARVCTSLYPDLIYDDLVSVFEEDLVDPIMVEFERIHEQLERDSSEVLSDIKTDRHYQYLDDAVAATQKWFDLYEEKPLIKTPHGQVVRQGRKIGRNEPCPCGSGLKYKKCCGGN